MFENHTTITFAPGKFDEGVLTLRAYILPILRNQPGLLSLAVFPLPGENHVVILSMWQSCAHARQVECLPDYRRAIEKLDGLLNDVLLFPAPVKN